MAPLEDAHAAHRCAADPSNLTYPYRGSADGVPAASTPPPLLPDPTSPVVDGVEDEGVWRRYREETLAALQPVGFAETELAEAIALLSWRLRRVGRLEADMLAHGFVSQNEETAGSRGRGRIGGCERVLAVICRYEGRIERARDRAVKELRALQQARRATGPAVPQPATTPHPGTIPSPGAVASFGPTAGAGDSATPRTVTTPDSMPAGSPGAAGPGALASFGRAADLVTRDPVPMSSVPAGEVASFGKMAGMAGVGTPAGVATRPPARPSGRPASRSLQPQDVATVGSSGKTAGPPPRSPGRQGTPEPAWGSAGVGLAPAGS